ncbi:MAG: hypothetical protein GX974_09650 [Clostridiales bacterium]|nr:hypothetical protein [Clostridiales bacterium]
MHSDTIRESWQQLYDLAIEIRNLKPWEHFWDLDTITVKLPNIDKSVLCSIMGRGGEFTGIGLYIGQEAIDGFYNLVGHGDAMPGYQVIRFQDHNVIMCTFGDRDDLSRKEWEHIKDLGYSFRGRGNWIYFHSYQRGFMGHILDEKEVGIAIEVFRQLLVAIREYIDGNIDIDFENGKTLMCEYNEETQEWENKESPIIEPQHEYFVPVIEDELLIARLKNKKGNKRALELDIAYTPSSIKEEGYDRLIAVRLCIIADVETGMVLDQELLAPDSDDDEIALEMLISYITKMGRPDILFVRDYRVMSMVIDLCEKVGIELEMRLELDAIDQLLEDLMDFM